MPLKYVTRIVEASWQGMKSEEWLNREDTSYLTKILPSSWTNSTRAGVDQSLKLNFCKKWCLRVQQEDRVDKETTSQIDTEKCS